MEQDTLPKRYFKEGDEVAHKENLSLKLEVRRIIKTKRKEFGSDNGEPRSFILGVECGWWVSNDYHKEIFHTKVIIPWDVAQLGFMEVIKYLEAK